MQGNPRYRGRKWHKIAPFLRYTYSFILSTFATVSSLKIKAPRPLLIKMRGTDRTKAKAPITPSIEKVASMTSRYKIYLCQIKNFSLKLIVPRAARHFRLNENI